MKPNEEEINNTNENSINPDIDLLLAHENIFQIPEIYKQDYRGKNDEETRQMMKDFIKKLNQKEENKENKKEEKFDDVVDFQETRFEEVNVGGEIEYRETKKPKNIKDKKIKDSSLYSFKVDELVELEKYLKTKIIGQDHIIEEYINSFLLNTYRDDNNSKNLGIYFNFGPSGAGKNYIWELISKKLDFGLYNYSLSSTYYVEATSLLGSTDGFSISNSSIFEHIENISSKKKATIIIFDEIEKGVSSENGSLSTFFTAIMNIIDNRYVNTKNSNVEIDQANFIFVFNSNIGYDEYESNENTNKIGFNVGENHIIPKVNIDADYIENYFKNKQKINISVFNRLKRGNNFFFFNSLETSLFKEYFEKEFRNLKIELCYNFDYSREKLPDVGLFQDKINDFDSTKGYRGINDIIHIETKLFLMKNYIFKNQFRKGKLVGLRK